MFLRFFDQLRQAGVPVSLREFLVFLEGVEAGLTACNVEGFYFLARATMVKDERHLDPFDRAFAATFKGMAGITKDEMMLAVAELPRAWLEKLTGKHPIGAEERFGIKTKGGFDKLIEELRERLRKQKARHQGGNIWIGTAGTSPFGAYGYAVEGMRIGQDVARHQQAVKIWDARAFRNLDDTLELGTRNIKVALKRLRRWARDGLGEELDLNGTIQSTAERGYLDVQTRPERRNAVKILLFLDAGGSMDPYVRIVEELFSAARAEFKHLKYFYFHNCLYESVWRDNQRRRTDRTPTWDILRTFGPDYKCIFVGDASMSPYEIMLAGGASGHWNEEPGQVWLERIRNQWPGAIWINPVNERYWDHTQSIQVIRQIFRNRMYPMTLAGITQGMKELGR